MLLPDRARPPARRTWSCGAAGEGGKVVLTGLTASSAAAEESASSVDQAFDLNHSRTGCRGTSHPRARQRQLSRLALRSPAQPTSSSMAETTTKIGGCSSLCLSFLLWNPILLPSNRFPAKICLFFSRKNRPAEVKERDIHRFLFCRRITAGYACISRQGQIE